MTDVTNILSKIEDGDPSAAEKLLPLVYDELRKLVATRMAEELSDQATALVHEAYVRLVEVEKAQHWNSRDHFFGATAEAMLAAKRPPSAAAGTTSPPATMNTFHNQTQADQSRTDTNIHSQEQLAWHQLRDLPPNLLNPPATARPRDAASR